MATTSFTVLRRFAGFAFTLMLVGLCLTRAAVGQGSPLVTASSAAGLSHPTGWGTIQESAIDQAGDWFVVDYANGALYEFPAGGGAAIVIGSASPTASLGGGYQNPVIFVDPGNNLYVGANWNNCIVMFPWNAATKTWTGLTTPDTAGNELSPSNPTTTICTNSGIEERARSVGTVQRQRSHGHRPWVLSAVGYWPREQQRPDCRRPRRLQRHRRSRSLRYRRVVQSQARRMELGAGCGFRRTSDIDRAGSGRQCLLR